jgi:MarR family transcriptional regulator, organic hydroperoxide resistance regulator
VTRTIAQPKPGLTTAVAGNDPATAIIADFRATLGQLKCASSERLLRLGVSMAQLHIMYTLQRTGEMTMSHLADVLNVSLSNATGLIDRLEERGYIARDRVATDRRIVMVHVTPVGERMLGEADALSDELFRSVLDRLPASQLRGVANAISALREAVTSTVESMPNRHVASTMAPRSGSRLRGTDHTSHPQGRD